MSEENQKQALLEAAKALMEEASEPEKITSRRIGERAGVNAAMINYYYGSKDALLSQAADEILGLAAGIFRSPPNPSAPPKERLRQILGEVCLQVLKYRQYTKILVPRLLLEEEISLPQYLLPEIREHFGAQKSEIDCRIIAYEMVSFMQLAFYRLEAFMRYTGINLSEESACFMLIDWELNQFLPEVKTI